MKKMITLGSSLIALLFSGCLRDDGKESKHAGSTDEEVGSTTLNAVVAHKEAPEKLESRVGYLADKVSQHPLQTLAPGLDGQEEKAESEFYFDVGDRDGLEGQIIVIHPADMKIPTEHGRRIELRGVSERIDLGRDDGKGSYEGESFHLKSWRYSD